MLKTFEITLDVEKEIYNPSEILFSVSRNDFNSVELLFTIYQDGEALDLTGKTVELAIKKPSGLVIYQPAEIREATRGKAAALLSVQAYSEFGMITAEMYIRNEESMTVTSPFYFMSRETIIDEEIESYEEYTALQQVIFGMDKKPVLVEGIPEIMPEYIGQLAFDTVEKRAFIAYELTNTGWELITAGEGGTGIARWADILGKPSAFPPEVHNHDWDEIKNTPETYPAEAHNHTWSEITGTPEKYPAEDHEHTWSEITETPSFYPAEAHNHDWDEITGKPAAYPAEAHNHEILDVNGLQAALDSKADVTAPAAPAEHTHEIADVNGLQSALDSKADDAELAGKADVNHNHGITDVTGLQAALDAKQDAGNYAPSAHNHDWDEITGKPAAYPAEDHNHDFDSITGKPAAYPAEDHGHDWNEITGKPTAYPAEAHTHEEYMTQAELDARYALRDAEGGTIQPIDWGTITGDISTQTDLQAALNAKQDAGNYAPTAHNHDWDEITGKPLSFPPEDHNHEIADVNGLQATLDSKADDAELAGKADAVHTHDFDSITGKPAAYPAEAHNHGIADVSGLQGELDGKADKNALAGKADAVHTHDFDSITGKPAAYPAEDHGHDWNEITGKPTTFTPEAHNHEIAEVSGLQSALDSKADDAELAGKADVVHTHDFDSITGKPAAYPAEDHTHEIADVNGLQAALDAAGGGGGVPEDHTHEIADVNGLSTQLNAKQTKPIVSTQIPNLPTVDPSHTGQLAIDSTGKRSFIAHGATAADWERIATTSYVDVADNFIINTLMGGLKLWKGTQAQYDALTKDPNTLYFITG